MLLESYLKIHCSEWRNSELSPILLNRRMRCASADCIHHILLVSIVIGRHIVVTNVMFCGLSKATDMDIGYITAT